MSELSKAVDRLIHEAPERNKRAQLKKRISIVIDPQYIANLAGMQPTPKARVHIDASGSRENLEDPTDRS